MKARGYRTQCDSGGLATWLPACSETKVLDKPSKWRCPSCVEEYGEIQPDPAPTPRMP